MRSACKPTLTRSGGRITMTPRSASRITEQSGLRCIALCSSMLRPSSHRPNSLPASTCGSWSRTGSTHSQRAVSSPAASCGGAAGIAHTTSCWPSAASAGGFAPRATCGGVADGDAPCGPCVFPPDSASVENLTAGNLTLVGVGLRCVPVSGFSAANVGNVILSK